MATNNLVAAAQSLESCGDGDSLTQTNTDQVPDKCGAIAVVQPPPSAAAVLQGDSAPAPPKVLSTVKGPHSTSSAGAGQQTSSPSVMVVANVAPSRGVGANSQLQAMTPGKTVVITVPRTAASQPIAVAPCLQQTTAPQLPANVHIPSGMMLIRSESGQLMLVSQQALAQAPHGTRVVTGQAPRIVTHKVSAAAGGKSNEKVTVIRMAAPPSLQPAQVQTAVVKVINVAPKPAVVQTLNAVSERGRQPCIQAAVKESRKEPPSTFSQETLESVKKCKNFLVTLIKLASSDSRSANMANNVRGLVRSLLEGKLEAEEFTERLYQELKSTPQPCLVPFLKKSIPAVRRLTADPQLFIQQASASTCNSTTSSMKSSISPTGQTLQSSRQSIQRHHEGLLRPGLTFVQSRNNLSKSSRPTFKHTVLQTGRDTGTFSMRKPFSQDLPHSTKSAFRGSSGSYKEDDDINDVAFMAGVNLREENAQILTTMVGSVVQSCQDQTFLSRSTVLSRILCTGQALGITDVGPEVVALVSHATQECLRGLLEKLTVIAEHRKVVQKEDLWHSKVSDVRSQLRFIEEVECLNTKRRDEEEKERLLHLARSRSHTEDPHHQQLKQRAKELQQIEEAQLQQKEANLAALAAIGPRRKRPVEQTVNQVSLLSRLGVHRVTRVMLRDLLVCMEQDSLLRHSLTLYRAML